MIHSLLKESESFESFLNRKALSEETKKLYHIFLERLLEMLNSLEAQEITQEIADGFIEAYPHVVSRAFLKNYLEFKRNRDIFITKKTGRVQKKVRETIPENELELIREKLYSHDERFGLMFDITVNCALRRQEVLGIKVRDIKVEEGDKMFIKIVRGKGNKERMVYVSKDIAVLILHYCFNNHLKNEDYMFTSKTTQGKMLDKTSWNKAFKRASVDAVGKRYHPHQLRSTRATEWLDNGIDILSIMKRLGHSDVSTTMIYLNLDAKKELDLWSNEN